jgi:TATA-box binding protein (TBP) (component of TFIID and TFIIIB)
MKTSRTQITQSIDDEWSQFISSKNNNSVSDDEDESLGNDADDTEFDSSITDSSNAPEASPIYISTKSKVAYLNIPIDLRIFWKIPVIPYSRPTDGIIKKQIKSNTTTVEDYERIQEYLTHEIYYEEQVIMSINNPTGRIKFKDSRKITIGMSKKDIMSYRSKKKSAFYNCFVLIMRIKMDGIFKEFHVKVFNTGELDIPGIQSESDFEIVLETIIQTLQPHIEEKISYKQISDTVLINSNFNCGFFIDRESLFDILRSKYNIQSIFDPCSYPGIQSKFYYNNNNNHEEDGSNFRQTGIQVSGEDQKLESNIESTRVSFMIFRTGSVLIVGKCNEHVLVEIYNFLVNILKTEYLNIRQTKSLCDVNNLKDKKKKVRRKKIMVSI